MAVCKVCGNEVQKGVKVCPGCGAAMKKPVWRIVLIVVAVLIGLSFCQKLLVSLAQTIDDAGISNASKDDLRGLFSALFIFIIVPAVIAGIIAYKNREKKRSAVLLVSAIMGPALVFSMTVIFILMDFINEDTVSVFLLVASPVAFTLFGWCFNNRGLTLTAGLLYVFNVLAFPVSLAFLLSDRREDIMQVLPPIELFLITLFILTFVGFANIKKIKALTTGNAVVVNNAVYVTGLTPATSAGEPHAGLSAEKQILALAERTSLLTLKQIISQTSLEMDEAESAVKKFVEKGIAKEQLVQDGKIIYDFS